MTLLTRHFSQSMQKASLHGSHEVQHTCTCTCTRRCTQPSYVLMLWWNAPKTPCSECTQHHTTAPSWLNGVCYVVPKGMHAIHVASNGQSHNISLQTIHTKQLIVTQNMEVLYCRYMEVIANLKTSPVLSETSSDSPPWVN